MRELPNVGDTVYFNDYSGHGCDGKVIAVRERGSFGKEAAVCVCCGDEWKIIELRNLFASRSDAILAAAQSKQHQASRLLSEAAQLFGRVIPTNQESPDEEGDL